MANEALTDDLFEKTVEKLSDLYIRNRTRYLKLNSFGKYNTEIFTKNTATYKDDSVPLQDFHIRGHLRKRYTIGVFANRRYNITPFICFDVDVNNNEQAKEVVGKIIKTLNNLGIDNEFIYVSWSGNRGYHVEIFFSRPIKNNVAEVLFYIVNYKANLLDIDYGKVEFRPTNTQGVKLPLGVNFKGENALNNFCFFVDYENDFNYIRSKEYVLQIQKISSDYIYDIFAIHYNVYEKYLQSISADDLLSQYSINDVSNSSSLSNIPSINYMAASLDELMELENEGLTQPGTRNNATVGLAILYKCHYGLNSDECIERLIDWMNWQDTRYYKTPINKCVKEIKKVVKCVFNNNYQLSGGRSRVEVSKKEIEEILKVKAKNGKLVLFALLLYSKKFTKNNGNFYMPFSRMERYTGLSKNTCVTHVNKLIDNNFIEAVSRGKYFPDGKSYKANTYKVLIGEEKDDPVICFNLPSNLYFNYHKKIQQAFLECLSTIDEKIIRERLNKKDFSYYKNNKYYII